MEIQDKYDAFINIALTNLFTLGKENKVLNLYNYKRNNSGHLAILHIANMVHDIFDYQITINTSLWNYIGLRLKLNPSYWLKRSKKQMIDIDEFILSMETDGFERGIFSKIYHEYYKESDA